jgi:Arc/MetJ-type ribon-helix-helix transcriptional regulator
MMLSLSREMQEFVQSKVKSGEFKSPDDVMQAALSLLMLQAQGGDFGAGEIDALIDEAEDSINREGTIPAEEFFKEMDQVSREYRSRPK